MVQVQKRVKSSLKFGAGSICAIVLVTQVLFVCLVTFFDFASSGADDAKFAASFFGEGSSSHSKQQQDPLLERLIPLNCPYKSLNDLSPDERFPKAGPNRHIVDPPPDTKISLVCCETTVGPWNIAVHHAWAPLGAKRFMDMVNAGYFGKVPLFRCIEKFICQFGLKGKVRDDERVFNHIFADDKAWLPKGAKYRKNDLDVKRFAKGYFAYAGAGTASRSNQLIVALHENGPLGGGSPWETPFAELVGKHSFDALDKVYTGYGEDGPSQGLLYEEGALDVVAKNFQSLITFLRANW